MIATASRVEGKGEVILKVVNTSPTAQQLAVDLQGVKEVNKGGTMEVLSGQPGDVNTIAEPEKVVPRHVPIEIAGPKFVQEFPPHSVSVIRLKAK